MIMKCVASELLTLQRDTSVLLDNIDLTPISGLDC